MGILVVKGLKYYSHLHIFSRCYRPVLVFPWRLVKLSKIQYSSAYWCNANIYVLFFVLKTEYRILALLELQCCLIHLYWWKNADLVLKTLSFKTRWQPWQKFIDVIGVFGTLSNIEDEAFAELVNIFRKKLHLECLPGLDSKYTLSSCGSCSKRSLRHFHEVFRLSNRNKLPPVCVIGLTFTCSKSTIKNTVKRFEVFSKLTIKTPERRQWQCFIVNFGHISHLFLVFLFLSLNK